MTLSANEREGRPVWFVGANFGRRDDQFRRFLAEGIWENGYSDRYLDLVKSIRPGDRIAIKSSYTRKRGLPFDNGEHTVSVMAIKATGIVRDNLNDGRRLRVDWTEVQPAREWYFYVYQKAVWKVTAGSRWADALIAFTFDNQPQDIDTFRNAPFWRDRFGSGVSSPARFGWTRFYAEMADRLLRHREDRGPLVEGLRAISSRFDEMKYLHADQYGDGGTGFVRDICPFTTLAIFNRGIKDANRRLIASEFAHLLDVREPVPDSFEGIPVMNNQNSWFFGWEKERPADQIDKLWRVFSSAIELADNPSDEARDAFIQAFDDGLALYNVGWSLTSGLYWIRPWHYPSLDNNTRKYIANRLALQVGTNGPNRRCSGEEYLRLIEALETTFQSAESAVHSCPELVLQAWLERGDVTLPPIVAKDRPEERETVTSPAYTVDSILAEGCFLERSELTAIVGRLRSKKNLILQGPPGTGKTWLARRLAYALLGRQDDAALRAVQFHPNLSYEDFVRGWRPVGNGTLAIADGVFMDAIRTAHASPTPVVVVIEEINRGHPAQVFGELLTLLEATKRHPGDALELSYPDPDGVRRPIYIPENLYVIGTMNIADRSLAMVDFALRRRFAFVNLEPRVGAAWRQWVVSELNMDVELATEIESRMAQLNAQIAADSRLGKAFMVGHSYVTPGAPLEDGETRSWFEQVVETEIRPLLEEYWFDAPDEAQKAAERLVHGW